MARINMIHHINIQITDRQRTREWYERVLGAEFLERGPALNQRQLQLRIGNAEVHTSDVDEAVLVPRVHFALEVGDWDDMLQHLENEGVPYSRNAGGAFGANIDGNDPGQGQREDTDEHYTYISDPDGNLIELVQHPLGLEDGQGQVVELVRTAENLKWAQIRGLVESAYAKT